MKMSDKLRLYECQNQFSMPDKFQKYFVSIALFRIQVEAMYKTGMWLILSEPGHMSRELILSPGVGVGCVDKNFNLGHNFQTI